jgi:NAD(P)-dependent dehydrogenase (short-subunit alcohol dehydrogenase family)
MMFLSQSNIERLTHASAGHFYLTKLLLPILTAAAKKSPPGTVRVINISSIVHYMSAREGIRWATISGPDAAMARRKLGVPRIYGQSKLVKCTIHVDTATF